MTKAGNMDGTSDNTINDAMLIKGYLAGNTEDFNTLYERYKRQLYAYLNRMLAGSGASPDDVFQKTWIKAIDNLPKYEHKQVFLAWLIRIAHNIAVDSFRKTARAGETVISLDSEDAPHEVAAQASEPWRDLQREELAKAIETALDELAPELREVFLMRRDDVPFKEIAKIQNCSINTALARMQYALKNLRRALSAWNEDRGGVI